jgi:hypothetical protein
MLENYFFINIGDKVRKKSRKPFKSREKINTVKAITKNPYTDRLAFSFIEDSSVVDAYQCVKAR